MIAVFYHARISGGAHEGNGIFEGNPALDEKHARGVVHEQADALFSSGLLDAVDEFTIGLNGTPTDYRAMRHLFGPVNIHSHGPDAASELPTMALIQEWAKTHPHWFVLYIHSKGVSWPPSKPGWEMRRAWRRCLMRHTVANWTQCITDLKSGFDMVGPHWITAEKYPQYAHTLPRPIWGGNFFWAKSDYLAQLAPLLSLEKDMHMGWRYRYQAEHWPTSGPWTPRVVDYAPHWPGGMACARS